MSCTDSGIRRLILASSSLRRRQLLPLLGLPFVVKAVEVDEAPWPGEPPTELVLRVSRAKAYAGSSTRPDELVIAADTVVAHDGEVLGKPRDAEEAIQMLQRLRSRPHLVYSGVSVWHPSRRRLESELAETLVWMRNYSDEEIARYVESGDPWTRRGRMPSNIPPSTLWRASRDAG